MHFNVFRFGHCHIGTNNHVVFHAHPFNENNNQPTSFPTHAHTQKELVQLALYIEIIGLLFILPLIMIVTLQQNERGCPSVILHFQRKLFRADTHRRGPPSNIQFSL
jgi:hypothetical protein